MKDASARGKVKLSFTVNETGRVVEGAAHGFASEVDECIASQMVTWRFPIPKDKDGEATDASYEFSSDSYRNARGATVDAGGFSIIAANPPLLGDIGTWVLDAVMQAEKE